MNAEERKTLVTSWLAWRHNYWASEALHRQIAKQPQEAWLTLLGLIDAVEGEDLLEFIGAGPLEDLFRAHADELIALVESEASGNTKLRVALGNVWVQARPEPVVARLAALGCQLIPVVKDR